jgi:hypothetical protein
VNGVYRSDRIVLAGLGGRGLLEFSDLAFEVGEILETLVDRSEPQVGHVVEGPEPLEYRHTDPVARNLEPDGPELLFDVGDELIDRCIVETPVSRALDPRPELDAVERFDRATALGNEQRCFFDPFVGGEPPTARKTLATATNRRSFLTDTRVDNLVVVRSAVRTAHENTLILSVRVRLSGSNGIGSVGRHVDRLAGDQR